MTIIMGGIELARSRYSSKKFDARQINKEQLDSILTEYQLCLNFFNLEDAGKVLARGCKDKGDISRSGYLDEAIKLGLTI